MDQHTFTQTLEAYQADLDTKAAVALVQELERDRQTVVRPIPTPDQVALTLITGIKTIAGRPIHWPIVRSGQRYALIIRATRLMLERIFKNKIILEGTPRGTEIDIEITKIAADITKKITQSYNLSAPHSPQARNGSWRRS